MGCALRNPNSPAVLPFINSATEPLTIILWRPHIRVVNKPFKTLQQEFTSPKLRPSIIEHQLNVIYKIPCADWDWCYVSETGYCFETRKKKHSRNVKTCANGSNIVKNAWSINHRIDFDIFRDIYKISFCVRKTLEAWHTSDTKYANNNSRVFFLNNSWLIDTFLLCFILPFFSYIFSFCIPFISIEGCSSTAESSHYIFFLEIFRLQTCSL